MTWKTLFWALAVWAFWGIPFSLSAQTVRFQVKDAETGKSVSGAVVRAVEKGGRTVRYGLTDQGGLAEMTPPQETDTLTISLLGYRKQSFLRPFQSQYQVALETEALRILEGLIDVYLPDMKFYSEKRAARYCRAADYPKKAKLIHLKFCIRSLNMQEKMKE